jgi:hypothetical protein
MEDCFTKVGQEHEIFGFLSFRNPYPKFIHNLYGTLVWNTCIELSGQGTKLNALPPISIHLEISSFSYKNKLRKIITQKEVMSDSTHTSPFKYFQVHLTVEKHVSKTHFEDCWKNCFRKFKISQSSKIK